MDPNYNFFTYKPDIEDIVIINADISDDSNERCAIESPSRRVWSPKIRNVVSISEQELESAADDDADKLTKLVSRKNSKKNDYSATAAALFLTKDHNAKNENRRLQLQSRLNGTAPAPATSGKAEEEEEEEEEEKKCREQHSPNSTTYLLCRRNGENDKLNERRHDHNEMVNNGAYKQNKRKRRSSHVQGELSVSKRAENETHKSNSGSFQATARKSTSCLRSVGLVRKTTTPPPPEIADRLNSESLTAVADNQPPLRHKPSVTSSEPKNGGGGDNCSSTSAPSIPTQFWKKKNELRNNSNVGYCFKATINDTARTWNNGCGLSDNIKNVTAASTTTTTTTTTKNVNTSQHTMLSSTATDPNVNWHCNPYEEDFTLMVSDSEAEDSNTAVSSDDDSESIGAAGIAAPNSQISSLTQVASRSPSPTKYRKTIQVSYMCLCCERAYLTREQIRNHVRTHFTDGTLS